MPGSTLLLRIVPVTGARTSQSSSVICAFSSATWDATTCACAFANSRSAFSTSVWVSVCDLNSWFARSSWVFAIASRAFAAESAASLWATLFFGVRLSISMSSVLFCTTSPISACTASTSPDAFDFTSTSDSGSMAPDASTVTSMLRVSTGAES